MKTCPRCGSTHVEEMGTKPGDWHWFMCRDCSVCWDDDKEEQKCDSSFQATQ